MILKSYNLEKSLKTLEKYKIFLFYGENEGLKRDFKLNLRNSYKDCEILNFYQDDITKNENNLINEVKNRSLFDKNKIIFISQVNDKLLSIIENILDEIVDEKVFLFSDILDKKSKLRSFFEKSDICGISACYKDNEIAIRSIILKKLSKIKGVSTEIVNLIIRNTNLDRNKVNNEVDKIISCFQNSSLDFDKVNALLNQETNDDFNLLKDEALNGNKNRTNQLLSDTVFSAENNIYYLNLINQRIQKLLIIENLKQSGQNIEAIISNLKPPVFWKDKPMILSQSRRWNKEKIQNALKKTLDVEIDLKTKNITNKDVLIKNLIVELCVSANAS